MEVEGKRILDKYCLLCKNHGKNTQAHGYCINCEHFMCNVCFENHKLLKVARYHILTESEGEGANEVQKNDLDVCSEHDESIKFYCPSHEVVGCGDCMILKHKPCSIEYVREKAKVFKGSEDFSRLVKGLSQCQEQVSQVESAIKNNKEQVSKINEKFVTSVKKFKDQIVSHVNKAADTIIEEAANVQEDNNQRMNDLEKERKSLSSDVTSMQQAVDAQMDQPSKLFISSIQQKPRVKHIPKELENIKSKNVIDSYHFEPDSEAERVLKDGIGRLQRAKDVQEGATSKSTAQNVPFLSPDKAKSLQDKIDVRKQEKEDQTLKIPTPLKPQPLKDRQLVCRNIEVDGEYLSYADNGSGDVGLYLFESRYYNDYIEIEIISTGQRGTIALGYVPVGYPENHQPGWGEWSVGYHADDGRLYHGRGKGKNFGPKCKTGDRMGCNLLKDNFDTYATFTRNGKKVGDRKVGTLISPMLYPAIGLHSTGEKVKVIFDAQMPQL